MKSELILDVQGLTTVFKMEDDTEIRAVDDVSFNVKSGETVAIVGESGSGKSVTAMSIMRLIPNPPGRIVSGKIHFEGNDLLSMSEEEARAIRGNKISMIFQEPMTSLNPSMTVGRQISEPAEVHSMITNQKASQMSQSLLDAVRIPDSADRVSSYPHEFSGGMRQRVMIAMGMSCNPKLIIADEPTTALDVTVQAQVLHLLKDITYKNNASLILITHDLGVVARYADRVNVMYAGKIVESGKSRDIFNSPQHPYTLALMNSIPRLSNKKKEKLKPIRGNPPDLAKLPVGCSFNPRCDFAIEQCFNEKPILTTNNRYQSKACWATINDK